MNTISTIRFREHRVPNDLTAKRGGKRDSGAMDCARSDLPLVSVITAVFNGGAALTDCIESVLQQDYPNIEHLIIDGGSTDGTIDVLKKYDDKLELWVSEPDHGVYDAWNKGLDLARGEWIAFLGADDTYMPGAIRAYMDLARQCPEAEFLSSRALLNHPTGYAPVFGGPWEWPRFSTAMTTIHVGTMHRRTLFEQYGQFDTTYRIAADYQFLLRARDRLRAGYIPETTVVMRAGGISDSTAGLYEARRAKVNARVRSASRAHLELMIAIARFHLRRGFLKVRALFV
jgi:glycosyltransferase involved in cell wall biosynthesis